MVTEAKTIRVTAETDLPALLDAAAKAPVLLDRNGETPPPQPGRRHRRRTRPELVRQSLETTAGRWADLDVDRILRDLGEARRAGSRSPNWP